MCSGTQNFTYLYINFPFISFDEYIYIYSSENCIYKKKKKYFEPILFFSRKVLIWFLDLEKYLFLKMY